MDEKTQIELSANHEWRFEVPFNSRLNLKLVEGKAELFGTELALGREYEFSGQQLALYTYQGCKLERSNVEIPQYIAESKTMALFASVHLALQTQRTQSMESIGPRTIVVGAPSSGKTSLCKLLVSYAVKMESCPMLVNLDPANPVIIPPGALSASVISHILDIEDGWGTSPITGPAPYHPQQPLVYNYGLQSIGTNAVYYSHLMSQLGTEISQRLAQDEAVRRAGLVIDTPSDMPKDLLYDAIKALKVDSVLVLGNERLGAEIKSRHSDLTIVDLPRDGGVTELDDAFRRQTQRRSIAQYFFGSPRQPLSPFTVTEKFMNLTVYRILESKELTVGSKSKYLTKIEPSAILQNCVLAVVGAKFSDEPDVIASAETLGYVHVVEADEKRQSVKLLLPVPGRVPDRPLIMGEFQYHE